LRVMIKFYTKEPKPIEEYDLLGPSEMQEFLEAIVKYTQLKAKFVVYQVGECVGDFS